MESIKGQHHISISCTISLTPDVVGASSNSNHACLMEVRSYNPERGIHPSTKYFGGVKKNLGLEFLNFDIFSMFQTYVTIIIPKQQYVE